MPSVMWISLLYFLEDFLVPPAQLLLSMVVVKIKSQIISKLGRNYTLANYNDATLVFQIYITKQ